MAGYEFLVTVYCMEIVTDEIYFSSYAEAERWCNNNEIEGMECYISRVPKVK
jgi:hypothetical protein